MSELEDTLKSITMELELKEIEKQLCLEQGVEEISDLLPRLHSAFHGVENNGILAKWFAAYEKFIETNHPIFDFQKMRLSSNGRRDGVLFRDYHGEILGINDITYVSMFMSTYLVYVRPVDSHYHWSLSIRFENDYESDGLVNGSHFSTPQLAADAAQQWFIDHAEKILNRLRPVSRP